MTPVWPPKLNIHQNSSSLQADNYLEALQTNLKTDSSKLIAAMSYQIPQRDTSPHPTFRLHTPAVDFIENRLPEYHEAFDVRRVRYDASQGQFVALIPAPSQSLMVPDASPPTQPRPAPAPVADMKFWDEIFPDAMELLNNETPTQSKYSEEWGIRHLTKWQEVEAKLEKARQVYGFETGSQNVGKVRRKVRSLMDDHHVIAQQATKLVPNSEIATPIVGVINLMVDVSTCYRFI
jgi:hypothetical protein